MKRLIFTAIAFTMMVGAASAQDNKVNVVKQNAELIQRADCQKKVVKTDKVCPITKVENASEIKTEGEPKVDTTQGKIQPGKSLKPKKNRKAPKELKKVKPIKRQ